MNFRQFMKIIDVMGCIEKLEDAELRKECRGFVEELREASSIERIRGVLSEYGWIDPNTRDEASYFEVIGGKNSLTEIEYYGDVSLDEVEALWQIAKETGYPVKFSIFRNEITMRPEDDIDWIKSKVAAKIKKRH